MLPWSTFYLYCPLYDYQFYVSSSLTLSQSLFINFFSNITSSRLLLSWMTLVPLNNLSGRLDLEIFYYILQIALYLGLLYMLGMWKWNDEQNVLPA